MLFDLRGRGRRNTIKVIYAGLALLMGLGLVGFGIGSNVGGGGLFDAFGGGNNSTSGQAAKTYRQQRDRAEAALRTNRSDTAAWLQLIRANNNLSRNTEAFQEKQTFDAAGKRYLQATVQAYQQFAATKPKDEEALIEATTLARVAYANLGQDEQVVNASEDLAGLQDTAVAYSNFASSAYAAGQLRKADLARRRALSLASASQRPQIKAQLDQDRQQARQKAAQDATASATPGASVTAAPTG